MLLSDPERGNTMLLQLCEKQLQKCAKLQIYPHGALLRWAFRVCNRLLLRGDGNMVQVQDEKRENPKG